MEFGVPQEINVLTTRTRMKVLTAINAEKSKTTDDTTKNHSRIHSRIVEEIITTEASYLHQLEILIKFFMKPIEDKQLLSVKELNIVFGKIEGIYQVNQELLGLLQSNKDSVGRAFLEVAPYLKMYCSYANSFEEAISLIQKLVKTRKEFETFLHGQESRPEVVTKLNSLLITPVQRVPRYKLLLNELLHHTSCDSEDFILLQSAIHEIEFVASHINDCIREHDNMQKMLCIQRSLVDGQPKVVMPGRRFIKEGPLMKVSRKGDSSHRRIFFLFSDMLIYCKLRGSDFTRPSSLLCCCILPLKHCAVEALFDCGNKQGSLIKLTCKDETLLLYTDNAEDGELWVEAIRSTIRVNRRFSEFRQTLHKESSAKRPLRRAAIKKQKMESLSQLNQKRKLEALSQENSSDCAMKDSLFPMREILKSSQCVGPCKKSKLANEISGNQELTSQLESDVESREIFANLSTIEEELRDSMMEDSLDEIHGQLTLYSGESNTDSESKENDAKISSSDSGKESSAEVVRMKTLSLSLLRAKQYFSTKSGLNENLKRKLTKTSCAIL